MMETISLLIDERIPCLESGGFQSEALETLSVHPSLVPGVGDQILVRNKAFVVIARSFTTGHILSDPVTGRTSMTNVKLIVASCAPLGAEWGV